MWREEGGASIQRASLWSSRPCRTASSLLVQCAAHGTQPAQHRQSNPASQASRWRPWTDHGAAETTIQTAWDGFVLASVLARWSDRTGAGWGLRTRCWAVLNTQAVRRELQATRYRAMQRRWADFCWIPCWLATALFLPSNDAISGSCRYESVIAQRELKTSLSVSVFVLAITSIVAARLSQWQWDRDAQMSIGSRWRAAVDGCVDA